LLGVLLSLIAGTSLAADPPATAGPVSEITSTSATLTGTIGPFAGESEGGSVSYRFEYGPNLRYSQVTATEEVQASSSPVQVRAAITKLRPGATYRWRLAVTFGIETVAKYGRVFSTPRGPAPEAKQPRPLPVGLSPVRVPAPRASQSWLISVACPTSSECLAVGGQSVGHHGYRSLAERWRSGTWRAVRTPHQPAAMSLERLSCAGPSSCLAVGGGLVERWNGRGWRRAPGPRQANVYLAALDCSSPNDCWASGEENGGTSQEAAVFAHWNGRSWSLRKAPRSSGVILESVSCASSRDCWAAGIRVRGRVYQPWTAYRWSGQRWQVAKLPSSGRYQGELSVSCHRASMCWAFGEDSRAKPVALRLVGRRWRRVPTTLPSLAKSPHRVIPDKVQGQFNGLSCISDRNCWAVGALTINGDVTKSLVEHWTGGHWQVASAGYPIPIEPPRGVDPGYPRTQLSSIDCPSTKTCVAVGETTFENRRHLIVRGKPLSLSR
jgi:hypothetical protein